jgi:hypothetical protein
MASLNKLMARGIVPPDDGSLFAGSASSSAPRKARYAT